MKKILSAGFIYLVVCLSSFGQSSPNPDHIPWSGTNRLTEKDFVSKSLKAGNVAAYAKFSMEYEVNGLDIFTKNFNQKVRNNLIRSASWIDPREDVQQAIRYQQTLFDLQEIHTRLFRKELKENRKRIAKGMGFIEEIDDRILKDMSQLQRQYTEETDYGKVEAKQVAWEARIKKELAGLETFAFDK
jgi:hypothetical protein